MNDRTLHFTIGPVQGFVAQSRRTRDLLASSFLLSYLSGHAMMAVIRGGGEIEYPYVQAKESNQPYGICQPLLQEIDRVLAGKPPTKNLWIGSLPNRFKAKIPDHFDPNRCVEAVNERWKIIAKAVWEYVFTGTEQLLSKNGSKTKEIWNRQVNGFWDIAWVIGEEPDLLNRRKHWRSHIPTEEGGTKCTLISNLQELSGYYRSDQQKEFWETLREKLGAYNLAQNERLSAIGLIKRIYPLVAKQAIGWEFPKEATYFPSSTYLAAFPWILRAAKEQEAAAIQFAQEATKVGLRVAKREEMFPDLNKVAKDKPLLLKQFANLEGVSFFGKWEKTEGKADAELEEAYRELKKQMGGEPAPYYAILLMDGDRLGTNLAKHGAKVSQALSSFSTKLEEEIKDYNGVTVYAGGDDVLALLPFDQALSAAVRLREKYLKSFDEADIERNSEHPPTISAAILFAHYMAPLKNVLSHAHHLLDEVAKKQNDRDSLAVNIWKRSGPDWQWVAKWDRVYDRTSATKETILETLAKYFSNDDEQNISGSFLYKWRQSYEKFSLSQEKEVITKLIIADYLRITGKRTQEDRNKAKEQVSKLVKLCYASGTFKTDGALLVRFLAQKGGGQV